VISKPQKKIKNLNQEINKINGDFEFSGITKDLASKGYEKKYQKSYRKEVITDMKKSKNSPQHEMLVQRLSLSNRNKSKFKSIF
jgi:hypothetical protein